MRGTVDVAVVPSIIFFNLAPNPPMLIPPPRIIVVRLPAFDATLNLEELARAEDGLLTLDDEDEDDEDEDAGGGGGAGGRVPSSEKENVR